MHQLMDTTTEGDLFYMPLDIHTPLPTLRMLKERDARGDRILTSDEADEMTKLLLDTGYLIKHGNSIYAYHDERIADDDRGDWEARDFLKMKKAPKWLRRHRAAEYEVRFLTEDEYEQLKAWPRPEQPPRTP